MINTLKIAKVLCDPIRYKILLMLVNRTNQPEYCCSMSDEGICNCDIMANFDMIQSRVSYHMKELVDAGLVREISKGKWKFYFLNKEVFNEFIRQLRMDFKL